MYKGSRRARVRLLALNKILKIVNLLEAVAETDEHAPL